MLLNQKERADCHGIPLEESIQGEGKKQQKQTTNKTRGKYTGGRGKQTIDNYKQTDVIYATFYRQITSSNAILLQFSTGKGVGGVGADKCVWWVVVVVVEKQGAGGG